MNCIIVDDDKLSCKIIEGYVHKYATLNLIGTYNDAIEARNILTKRRDIDLIFLDIMMPEMDGFQTVKKIKADPRLKNIPVFAVSAKAMSEDKRVILKHGFDDFIPKPVNSAIINYKLKKIFSQIKIV